MKRVHIKVYGRVQGVGFRFYTQRQAEHHSIVGWVRNNPDGSVEIDAEGNDETLEKFISEVKKGNMGSKVTDVDIDDLRPNADYQSFRIQH